MPGRHTPPPDRDYWVLVGMAVAATAATLASFSGLQGLAVLAGWPDRLAWLLPITLDAYAMTSARVWLAATPRTTRARRFARANALGAITASITGNAAFHTAEAGLLQITWPVVVIVGAVPAAVLGLTAHLHALSQPEPTNQGRRNPPNPKPDLMAAARQADARYRQAHDGRPITRDALRAALRISGPRATELRRQLATDRKEQQTNR